LDRVDEALFDKVIGVNLKGPFRLSAAIGTRMVEDGGGVIINISSVAAVRPDANAVPYAAAKAGLNALTEGLAQAFGPTVRVNAIQCGPFLTDVSAAWTPEVLARMHNSVALHRCGEANEIVGAVLYFATSVSSFCTGAILRVDGGMA
jgi:NAD(P)-dependent dehydrogenase (short-subunit alcohol dehydrogenase family)